MPWFLQTFSNVPGMLLREREHGPHWWGLEALHTLKRSVPLRTALCAKVDEHLQLHEELFFVGC